MVAALVALGYGIFRGIYFSPFDHVGYGHWLRDSGWQHPQPLPLGPLRLVWQDALLLGVIALSLPLELVTRLAVPVVAFAISYCIPAWNWSLAQRVYLFGYGLPWLIGCGILAVWAESIVGLSLVAIVCLVLSQMATTRALAKFDEYESSQPLALVSASKTPEKDPSAGWPATVLLTPTTERRWSPGHAIAAGAVVAWLVITIAGPADMILRQPRTVHRRSKQRFLLTQVSSRIYKDYMHFIGSLAILGVVIPCALMRVARYCGQLLPPISLWGRVRTGRFIIPGYDNVFIAPLAAVLIAIALPTSLVMVGGAPVAIDGASHGTCRGRRVRIAPFARRMGSHRTSSHRSGTTPVTCQSESGTTGDHIMDSKIRRTGCRSGQGGGHRAAHSPQVAGTQGISPPAGSPRWQAAG